MPVLRLFAAAREAAGEARLEMPGSTVGEVLEGARRRYGESFVAVLARSRVWVNGEPADDGMELREQDVVAVLPPVSGGAGARSASAPTSVSALPDPPPSVPPLLFPPVSARAPEPVSVAPEVPAAEALIAEPSLAEAPAAPRPPPPPPPPPPLPPVETPRWLSDLRQDEDVAPRPHDRRADEPSAPPPAPPPPAGPPSADDLLDRLAGLPPWPEDEPWYPDQPEPAERPRGARDDVDDSLWGPGSGPSWSVGEPEPRQQPAPRRRVWPERRSRRDRDRVDWGDDPKPPTGPSESPGESPVESPFAPEEPTDQPDDAERRWDDVLRWDTERPDPEALVVEKPPAPPGGDPDFEPAVRIIGPDPFNRPAADGGGGGDAVPVLGVVPPDIGGTDADARAGGSPAGNVLVRARPNISTVRHGVPATQAGAAAVVATATAPAPVAAPEPATRPAAKPRLPLAVVAKSTRPHGRLGLLWTVLTVAAILWGPTAAGIWLALCAGLAGVQTAKVWRARNEKPLVLLAAATAAALPLCAVSGLRAMTAGVVVAVVATLLARLFSLTKAPARDVSLTLAIGVVIGLAVASVVLLRNIGVHAPLLLLAFAAAYDAGAYLVGTGASSAWEGPAAGIATLIPVTMLSAVILVPPFPEGSPLLLGLLAAILAPCGPLAGSVLLGERDANAPALRRLDSLLVLAPVWAWCAAAFLR